MAAAAAASPCHRWRPRRCDDASAFHSVSFCSVLVCFGFWFSAFDLVWSVVALNAVGFVVLCCCAFVWCVWLLLNVMCCDVGCLLVGWVAQVADVRLEMQSPVPTGTAPSQTPRGGRSGRLSSAQVRENKRKKANSKYQKENEFFGACFSFALYETNCTI
eukprot:COSAG06_NODE_8919_length_2032_cov_3.031040_1_plen_160_part_00